MFLFCFVVIIFFRVRLRLNFETMMFGNLRIKIKDKISCFEMTDFKMTFPFWPIIGRMGKAFWKRKSQQRFWEEIRPYWTAKELPKAAKRDEFLSKFLRKNPADEWRRKFEKRVAKRDVFQSRTFEILNGKSFAWKGEALRPGQ